MGYQAAQGASEIDQGWQSWSEGIMDYLPAQITGPAQGSEASKGKETEAEGKGQWAGRKSPWQSPLSWASKARPPSMADQNVEGALSLSHASTETSHQESSLVELGKGGGSDLSSRLQSMKGETGKAKEAGMTLI